jgi:hypothetical protein
VPDLDQTRVRGWLIQIVISLISSLAVLIGAWLSVQNDVSNTNSLAESSRLESAFKRIEYLETDMREQQITSNAKIAGLTAQVFRLQAQLNKDINVIGLFEEFIDSLPFEAWLKEVEYTEDGTPKMSMLVVNTKYEYSFKVTRQRYEGAEDKEIWGEATAETFRETDLKALNRKSSLMSYQTFPKDTLNNTTETVTKLVVKLYLNLIEGRPMIFGMAIDLPPKT